GFPNPARPGTYRLAALSQQCLLVSRREGSSRRGTSRVENAFFSPRAGKRPGIIQLGILFNRLTQIPPDVAWDQSVPRAPSLDRPISRNAVSFFVAHCHVLADGPGSASPQSRVRARGRRTALLRRPPAHR